MQSLDGVFQQVFRHLFVYNILWEDTEVDERFLEVGPNSRVMGISAAGCGIANHMSRQPRSIDAVDINARHLAIAALKASSAREIESYDEFYGLWGHGTHADPGKMTEKATARMPRWIQKHWSKNHEIFAHSFHRRGLTAQFLTALRKLSGVDASWLRSLFTLPTAERRQAIVDRFAPVFRIPWVAAMLRSPIHLVALGVNYAQCDRMLRAEGVSDIIDFLLLHLGRVAETDLERNWFVWYAVAGHFNHDRSDAVPPFMRKDHHEAAQKAQDTELRFHHKNIFDVLGDAGKNTWTHYTLCDAPDWMPHAVQGKLLREIFRTSQDGAVFLHRSVEEGSMPERHGLDRHFIPMTEATEIATRLDRTRQFRRVAFYRVAH